MKKILTAIGVVALLFVATPSKAQVSFGLKGGYNIVDMSLSKDVINKSNRAGFYIGPALKISTPVAGFGVDIAAVYDQREAKLGDGANETTIKQKSINVPINARYVIGLGDMAGIYLAAGPQFGFNVGDTEFTLKDGLSYDSSNYQLKKSNFSVNVGGGLVLMDHFEIGVTYNIALGKTADITWQGAKDAYDSKNNAWQISAAYYF